MEERWTLRLYKVDRDVRKSEVEQEGLLECRYEEEWKTPSGAIGLVVQGGDTKVGKSGMFWDPIVVYVYVLCNILII